MIKFICSLFIVVISLFSIQAFAFSAPVMLWGAKSTDKPQITEIKVTAPSGAMVTYSSAKHAIKLSINEKSKVAVAIHAVYRATDDLDPGKNMEFHQAKSAEIRSKTGSVLKTDADVYDSIRVKKDEVINIGEIFNGELSDDVSSVIAKLSIIEDDGIRMSDEELHKKFANDLEAYAGNMTTGFGAQFVTYIPLVPIFYDLFNAMFSDTVLRISPITLNSSIDFVPTVSDLVARGSGVEVAYKVTVAGYEFRRQDTHDEATDNAFKDSSKLMKQKINK